MLRAVSSFAGLRRWRDAVVLKFFESCGYHTEIIKLYDEGLRKGESLMSYPRPTPTGLPSGG